VQLLRLYLDQTNPGVALHLLLLAGGDEPVWVQLLQLHLDHAYPGVAQQVAAPLAELQ
jgi:hypothetical protein